MRVYISGVGILGENLANEKIVPIWLETNERHDESKKKS